MELLEIKLTVQMEKSNSDAEHGETRILQQYALHRLRIEVEDYERYMDTITWYMDEETINDMRQKELKSDYVVNIDVRDNNDRPTVDDGTVRWVFRVGDGGQPGAEPEHLPVWHVLRAHYVECVCLWAHLKGVQRHNGRVKFTGLESFDSMEQRLAFVKTQLASVVELISRVLVVHWEYLLNVVENITFDVRHGDGQKCEILIDDVSKTLHVRVASADPSQPDIDAFLLERVRRQIEVSEQMRETVTDLRERTQEFAKKLGEELGGDMAVGTIQEDDVIAGLSRESLRYLCPPSAILAASIVYQFPGMDRSAARDCVVSSANQPSTLIWKWHIRVATDNTPDCLRCLRFWVESEGFKDTQQRDRLLVMRDYSGTIKAHVNPQDVDEKLVLGRWESFSLAECVGSEGRQTTQRVDLVSCMGEIYRTTRGDFVEYFPNVLNIAWEAEDKSLAELDPLRKDVAVYASDHSRRPPLLHGLCLQIYNMKDRRLVDATYLLLVKLAAMERSLTAQIFYKVNIDWTPWSRFSSEDGLARLAIFTLLTTLDRLKAAIDTAVVELTNAVKGHGEEDVELKSVYFVRDVVIRFDNDISATESTEKQVVEASPWTLVKSGVKLVVNCTKWIFDDDSEIVDIIGQTQRYGDIGTNEECPLLKALRLFADTVKNDQLKHALGQKMTRLAEDLALDNVSLTLSTTVPSLSTPKEFEVLHHPDLPGDVMAQYSSRLEEAMEPFLDAVSFISASGARDKLHQITGVEVLIPHADDTNRTYGITFRNGVLQYTLQATSDHVIQPTPGSTMFVNAIMIALKVKPKWSDKQTREVSAQELSVVERYRHALQLPVLESQNVFRLELRNIEGDLLSQAKPVNDGDITVSVLCESETITCESSLQDQTNGVVCVAWTPTYDNGVDDCLVDVRWRGDPVKGSPFPAALIPPDTSRHRALGRGRLVGQADGFIQAGSTWHQIVYHRPHGCRSLTEFGQFVRKKKMEQSGRRMTPGKFVKKRHPLTHLHRNGWHVKRFAALHVYHHQVGLEQSTPSVKSTKQRPVTARPQLISITPRLKSSRSRPMTAKRPITSKQRPVAASNKRPMTSKRRPVTSKQRLVTSKRRPMTSRPGQATSNLEPMESDQQQQLRPTFSVTTLADGHFLLRCRPVKAGTLETLIQCPVCKERLDTFSTTHSVLQTAKIIVMPGRISARKSYVEGMCKEILLMYTLCATTFSATQYKCNIAHIIIYETSCFLIAVKQTKFSNMLGWTRELQEFVTYILHRPRVHYQRSSDLTK